MKDQNSLRLEDKIRIQVESSRVRLTEFFIDYDRLRSGYVSKTQFRRVMDQIMKISLTDEEINALAAKYDTKNNSSINYKQFCNTINIKFPENELNENPESNVFKTPEYLGTFRSMKHLDSNEEMHLKDILTRLNTYYTKRNTDILINFRDFDRNNIGVLTESQFRRCMNEPTLSADDVEILIRKYQHPDRKGCINYLNFYNDVKINLDNSKKSNPNFQSINSKANQETGLSIQEIIDKIAIVSYKNGIRLSEFFKDFDRLKSGIITERQFSSGLIVGLEKATNLCPDEVYQLTEYFKLPDSRIDYKTFCDTVENVFNIPDMEKKPLAYVKRPPQGLLAKTLNGNLTPDEEEKVQACLDTISERVRKYKLQVFTYFKDYDRSTAFTRNVSKLQFGRVLSTLGLMPDIELYGLLCKKFEDAVSGDVNYPLFCQAVDDEYVSAIIENQISEEELSKKQIEKKEFPIDLTDVDVNELIARIRSHVLAHRIRIKEFFQDMDPLNAGQVTKAQFIRCISSFGISSIGSFPITKAQTEVLCQRYTAANGKVSWKNFEDEIESVFTVRNLEKNPNLRVAPTDLFIMPPQGTAAWNDENLESADNYKSVIDHLKQVVLQRRLDCWPPFKDYDKLNRGHVTKKQFYQSLNKIGLNLSGTEVAVLEAKFMDNLGFNYRHFLSLFQPIEVEKAKYTDLRNELAELNNTIKPVFESNPLFDVQSILIKIKDQVFKRRVSIYEWLRDHDKLNSGRLLKETFKRAIDLCKLDLQPSEIELIINYFSSDKDDRMVEYKEFCFEVEKAFTNSEMEKNPLAESEQHVPQDLVDLNVLLPNEVDRVNLGLSKIAERVRKQRIQLFPRFEDFDRIKNGFVTKNQFVRVLNDLNLSSILNETDLGYVIKKFSVRIGTRDDVSYVKFADTIYDLGSFEYRLP